MDDRIKALTEQVVSVALAEDVGEGDVTSESTVDASLKAEGSIVAREPVVLSGLRVVETVFQRVNAELTVEPLGADGERCGPGDAVLRVGGQARAILTGERVALNLLQRLSGVATLTRKYVDAVQGTGAVILDTRKTTPGLRGLEKQAVVHGGGCNHRFGLFDAILIKDNHLAALARVEPEPVSAAIRYARQLRSGWPIEVEADTVEQVRRAVEAGADVVLLDNMTLGDLVASVAIARGRAKTEASGGVTLETVREIAQTGVDSISVGALTHSARAVDFGLDFSWT